MIPTKPQSAAVAGRALISVALMLCVAPFTVARAADPNQPFCIPQVINVPGPTFLQAPSIDGVVSNDLGWTNARRHVFQNGTYVWDAAVQALRDATFLYFSFEVNHDDGYDTEDAIYLAFDPTGMDADRRLLVIKPVLPGGSAPAAMTYYHGYNPAAMAGTDGWAGAALPATTQAAATTSGVAPNVSYTVEVKIPRAGFGIPAAGPFGIFFDIAPVIEGLTLYHEYRWPEGTTGLSGNPIEVGQGWVDRTKWGQATTAATPCNGVYITAADIRTDNIPPSKINLNAANTFRVTVHNSTVDATGAPVAAQNVNATFKIANFGLNGLGYTSWTPVPPTAPATNPTAPVAMIAAGGVAELTTAWTLTGTQPADYATRPHQCILVELGSVPPAGKSTQFANRSAWTNMDFGTASTFKSTAQIDPRAWPRPAAGKPYQLRLFATSRVDELKPQEVLSRIDQPFGGDRQVRVAPSVGPQALMAASVDGRWASLAGPIPFPAERDQNFSEYAARLKDPKARVSQSTHLYHGCVRTGVFLDIGKGRKAERCERVGSYGYVLRHVSLGQAVSWKADIVKGVAGSRALAQGAYEMTVTPGQPVAIEYQFVATESESSTPGGGGGGGGGICGSLKLASGGALLAAFGLIGFVRIRRRKSE